MILIFLPHRTGEAGQQAVLHQCRQTGQFGAEMLVEIDNDGPVTIWIERE